jgi:nitric oxide reductase large subunit
MPTREEHRADKKLWIALMLVLIVSFAVLGGVGLNVLRSAPPVPESPGVAVGRGIL